MNEKIYTIHTDRNIQSEEFDALMSATGWGNDGYFTIERVAKHLSTVSRVAYIRDDSGRLCGYMSAIDNGYGVNHIDTIAIHPDVSQEDVGRMLVNEIANQCGGWPLYAMPFIDQQDAFLAEGFRIPGRPMAALSCFRFTNKNS